MHRVKIKPKCVFLLLIILALTSCEKEGSDCTVDEVAFALNLDLSSVLDHETTDSTTQVKIFYENYLQLGNLVSYKEYEFLNTSTFNETLCLPLSELPTDSLIIAIILIQNNQETNREAGIFLDVPYETDNLNLVTESISSSHLWDRPPCPTMPTVFQNIEDHQDGSIAFDIYVAGGFGCGLNVFSERSIDEIKLMGDDSLLPYYDLGWCPCSQYNVRFYE